VPGAARHRGLLARDVPPADRFWLFQAIEASIFVGMTLALLAFAV
jgi:hypothetical protein